jgi:Zn-dependent protease with chaperone function
MRLALAPVFPVVFSVICLGLPPMNFFERQDQARQQTRRLVVLFGLTVAAMTGGIYLAAVMFLGGNGRCVRADLPARPSLAAAGGLAAPADLFEPLEARRRRRRDSGGGSGFNSRPGSNPFFGSSRRYRSNCSPTEALLSRVWQPGLFVLVAGGTLGVIAIGSLTKIAQLSAGGRVVAESLGGRLLGTDNASPQERQLLNVVEEMAIAAGMAIPPVYLLDQESEINAFAAGFRPQDAVLGITRGSLEQLNRDELQGVIGHEFSHILNGDMGLNIRLMGVINGIMFIYIAGRMLMHSGSSSDRDGNSSAMFGLALLGLGSLGLLGGRLIQSAASRQREFLADASAVQFTRNPDGIAGALEKIGRIGSHLATPQAETASHLFFGNTLSSLWSADWFATHPPLLERVARIRNLPIERLQAEVAALNADRDAGRGLDREADRDAAQMAGAVGFAGGRVTPAVPPTMPDPDIPLTPHRVVAQVGTVTPAHYSHARSLLAQLPEHLREQVHRPQLAIATLYALFLENEPGQVQSRQLDGLKLTEPSAIWEAVLGQHQALKTLNPKLRLPLLDLTIPALRQCSPEILGRVLDAVECLAVADGAWSLSEFLQFVVLQRRLEDYVGDRPPTTSSQHKSLGPVWSDCLTVLSALASAGSPPTSPKDLPSERLAFSFQQGVLKLPGAAPERIPATPPPWTQTSLKTSLARLRNLTPKLQESLITACAHTVLFDNTVTLEEAELLRAITITLDCPIPPFLMTA